MIPFVDLNEERDVVEVELIAEKASQEYLPGKRAAVLAFRDGASEGKGSVPGPLLNANRGDRVIVHFRNELADEVTIHWHGLRLPNAADGTPASQMPVPPGGTYDYEFTAADEGTFWYHPHIRADELIERGLYGAVRIEGGGGPSVDADRVFMLDDVKLSSDGKLSETTDALDVMLGRKGNTLLVNGKTGARVLVRAGTRERWRFVNTANGRFFNLSFDDRPLLVIAWDGGMLPSPYETDRLLIAPGERYEVLVSFGDSDVGGSLTLQTVHYDRGHDIPDPGPRDLLQVEVLAPTPSLPAPDLPFAWGEWSPLPVTAETPVRRFVLKEEEGKGTDVRFMINDEIFPDHKPISGREGAVEIWEIENKTEMDHPFHLHGMFFQVLDVDGEPPLHRGMKDTVNVRKESTLRFAVEYGPPGSWMYHCHILEHAERGMMGELHITPEAHEETDENDD